MNPIGVILYLLLAAIIVMFWLKIRKKSLDDLLEQSNRDHHHVQKVIAKHSYGGSWNEHQQWMKEEDSSLE
jgi:hypothetical protein